MNTKENIKKCLQCDICYKEKIEEEIEKVDGILNKINEAKRRIHSLIARAEG